MRATPLVLLLTALVACDAPTTEDDDVVVDTDDPCAGAYAAADYALSWTAVRDQDALGMMMSVWGACQNDVWVVGGQKTGDGFALRGQGDTFEAQPLPADTPMLNWVHGVEVDDLWVGGISGTLLHWTGSDWEDHSLEEEGAIWGVHARSSDDALAVGGGFFGAGTPFAYRYDGTAWTKLTLPEAVTEAQILFKAYATGDGYAVVGSRGLALSVGASGVSVTASEAASNDDMVTIHAAPGHDPVAVGGFTGGAIWSLDATEGWQTVSTTPSVFLKLNGVHDQGNGLVTAVGNQGSTGVWDRGAGTWTEAAPFTLDLLHATWVAPNGDTYGVGGNFLTSGDTFHGTLGYSPGPGR